MKVCLYARQQCKYPSEGCPREEELGPIFAEHPEGAVHEVWRCEWAGSRMSAASYLMYLFEEKKVKVGWK